MVCYVWGGSEWCVMCGVGVNGVLWRGVGVQVYICI